MHKQINSGYIIQKQLNTSSHMLAVYKSMATEVGVQRHMAVAITPDSVMCTCLARVTCMIKPFGTMAGEGWLPFKPCRTKPCTNEAS